MVPYTLAAGAVRSAAKEAAAAIIKTEVVDAVGGKKAAPRRTLRDRFEGFKGAIDKHAWPVNAAADMLGRMTARANSNFGGFAHAISVTVQGGPQASLRRVWYLALSAAFGRLRNRVAGVQAANIEAEWNVTDKACTVTVGYQNSGLVGAVQAGGGSKASSPIAAFQRGPDQVTVGGSWPTFLTAFNYRSLTQNPGNTLAAIGGLTLAPIVGNFILGPLARLLGSSDGSSVTAVIRRASVVPRPIFALVTDLKDFRVPDRLVKFLQSYNSARNLFVELPRADAGGEFLPWSRVLPLGVTVSGPYGSPRNNFSLLPTLPDDGRVITTGQKNDLRVQNPRPPIDGKTRCSLVSLVAQALGEPGFLPSSPPVGFVPLHGPGVYVYDPGQGLEDEVVSNGKFTQAAEKADLDLPPLVVIPPGPDTTNIVGPDGYTLQQVIPNVRD